MRQHEIPELLRAAGSTPNSAGRVNSIPSIVVQKPATHRAIHGSDLNLAVGLNLAGRVRPGRVKAPRSDS